MRFLWDLTSLLGDHLTSIGDFFVLESSVIEPGDSLQYFHIVVSAVLAALLAFGLKKALETMDSHCGRRMIGMIGTLILFTYYIIIFYTRFSGETPEVLALNTSFLYLYLCVGVIIFVYYWKISNKKMADQLLEQRSQCNKTISKILKKTTKTYGNLSMTIKICFFR